MTSAQLFDERRYFIKPPLLSRACDAKQHVGYPRHRRHNDHGRSVRTSRDDLGYPFNGGRVLNGRAAKFHDDHGFWFIPCEPASIASDSVQRTRASLVCSKHFDAKAEVVSPPTKEAPRTKARGSEFTASVLSAGRF